MCQDRFRRNRQTLGSCLVLQVVLEVQPQGLNCVGQEAILLLGFFPELLKVQEEGVLKLLVSASAITYLLCLSLRFFPLLPPQQPPLSPLGGGAGEFLQGHNVLGRGKGSGMGRACRCGCCRSSGCSGGSSGGYCVRAGGRLLSGCCCCGCCCGDCWLMRHVSC